ncbi:hypothetical protein ACH473_18620 [Cellulosimicrobium funkei]|uniref:hypothetical protein n=1 Tax=Cellulosimicrobium funkei TaxID=264251 RepID=UPI00379BDCF1
MDELQTLAETSRAATVVVGNTEQAVPEFGIVVRQVAPKRLENIARACGRMHRYAEARISGDASIANAVFRDKKINAAVKTWVARSTDGTRIQSEIAELDFSTIDRILVSSNVTKAFLERRVPAGTTIEREDRAGSRGDETLASEPRRLVWVGTPDPNDGLQDFLRIAALVDLPVQLVWTRTPKPGEFTAAVAGMSMLRLEDRVEFSMTGTFESFLQRARRSREDGDVWFCASRDYPERSAFELLARSGAPIVAFDSMYARGLRDSYPEAVALVPEGDVLDAATFLTALSREALA